MKYLLIDFGASFIKNALYDDVSDTLSNYIEFDSPFIKDDKLSILQLKNILNSIIEKYPEFDFVITSSIKNGCYNNDIYESWKIKVAENNSSDLFSKIFEKQKTYHIHNDHNKYSNITTLKILGMYNDKIFLSCLGDTDCVVRSKKLAINQCILNLGTGSQVILADETISFIPSGRMLNVFYNFFIQLNLDIFEYFKKLDLQDIISSDLKFDLSVFPQAKNFTDYGKILNINETNFNVHNFMSSLMKNYLDQYVEYISKNELATIFLTGGIAQKLPVIRKYFEYIFPEKQIVLYKDCNVHLGMVEMIKNEKNSNNWM